MDRRWTHSLTNELDISVQQETRTSYSRATYRIEAPSLTLNPEERAVVTPGAAEVTTPIQQRSAGSGLAETIAVPNQNSIERVIIEWESGRGVLYLPSTTFLEKCMDAIHGDRSAADSIVNAVQTPVRLPLLTGSFLDPDDLVQLVDTITSADRYAASTIHSYRYAILRSALVNSTGLSVASASDFEALVNGFDAIEAIGSVSLIDCLAGTMFTIHDSVTETIDLLEDLGYDPVAFEQRDDGRFFTCVLAHIVLTDDVSAALGHVMQRGRHFGGNYERGKVEARNAPRYERGPKWRRLIPAAARESKGEFVYVLANALYWSGYAAHSDSRIQELLFRGASAVVDRINLPELEGWTKFERHLTVGHRLRSRNQFRAAENRFAEARRIAQRYDHLPEWQPQYNEVVVQAHRQKDAGQHKTALETLDSGIEALLQHDLRPESATRVVHHLKGQHCEIAAETIRSSDPQEARSLLTEARDHYDTIDFTRSRGRTKRKQEQIRRSSTESSVSSPSTRATHNSALNVENLTFYRANMVPEAVF